MIKNKSQSTLNQKERGGLWLNIKMAEYKN